MGKLGEQLPIKLPALHSFLVRFLDKSKIWLELRVGIAFAYHSCYPAGKFVQQENAPAAPSQLTESFGGSVPSLLAVICMGGWQ